MTGRIVRSFLRVAVTAAAATSLLTGCQIVSRFVTGGGGSTGSTAPVIASCSVLQVAPDASGTVSLEVLTATEQVITGRLAALGVAEAPIAATPPDLLTVSLPTGDDATWRAAMSRPGTVTFVPVPAEFDQLVVEGAALPDGMAATPLLAGDAIASASVGEDGNAQPAISLVFTPEAATAFDAFAAAHQGERVAIVVDGIVASAPILRASSFGGQVTISGSFTASDVASLVASLGSGPLPTGVSELSWTPAQDGICPLAAIVN